MVSSGLISTLVQCRTCDTFDGFSNMFLHSLTSFVNKKENYAEKLAAFNTDKKPKKDEYERIFTILCEFLMDPESTEDVAECFPQLLPALVSASISVEKLSFNDGDSLHKLNSVVLGKLISKSRDSQVFVLHYFDKNPAPFESIDANYRPSPKRQNRRRVAPLREVSDHDLVAACYDILCSAPMHFKYTWNWSKFYKYLAHQNETIRWLAMNCIAVVLGMSESCYLSRASGFLPRIQQFAIEREETDRSNITSEDAKETDETLDAPSVISVGGILLPIFNKSTPTSELNLVPVPSTRRNLQNLAFAVSSNRSVCLQGAVGSGKTALVEFLARTTGHDVQDFAKVQLGDQTDSKMLLGMYRCTDIPGEFLWQPGILTEAVLSGKWLLLEDIDCAATDVISVIGQLVETRTLSVPGYRDLIRVKSGFQLFVTRRFSTSGAQKHLQLPLQKHWSCVNVESLSKEELVTVVRTLFPVLTTIATRIVDVFLLFSVGNHEDGVVCSVRNGRQISTRDLLKWCSRAVVDFDVSSPLSALKIYQDSLDIFCYSVPDSAQRLNLAVSVAHKLGIVKTKAEFFCGMHKPSVNHHRDCLVVGRAKLGIKRSGRVKLQPRGTNFSYTRPSVCLLERIASCIVQKEPVLLVGETGTGKTSCVQYLAQITGHKLIVINMNQQSESTDLLGGYKPVDLKLLIHPIREEFEILFRSYFAIEPNQKFLNHIGRCFEDRKWKTLTTLMIHSTAAASRRLRASPKGQTEAELSKKWEKLAQKLEKLQSQVQGQYSLAFSFVEGSLVKALKNGDWVLLDEINLATAETLECLSGLLEGSCGSLSLLERGDKEPIKRHKDFAIFACMNPATDVGKKDLPLGLRNRFTEFFVDELTEKSDLQLLASSYLSDLNLPSVKIEGIVKFYLNVRKEAETNLLDGTGHKPHYSLRTLCRALSVSAQNPCANALRSLYEAFCLSFLTQLDSGSYPLVQRMIVKAILGDKAAGAVIGTPIPRPGGGSAESFISFEGYWIPKGDLEPQRPENYILTETVRRNLKDLVRVVSIGKMPVLLQGDTSVGKTSLITYLAKASGHICVRINNHEHTDLQEYVGTYVADSTGKLVFKEGILVDAMRKGYWIILDELNLAPSDVLEALNRVLDDNRELFIPETQQVVKADDNFMLFATQNPPGLYGGRKALSRAFRNRFVELHFDEIPPKELQVILQKRCRMPETYCKQVINVMTELQLRRKGTATFAGKKGFITLRDLFRWAERYHLAPDTGSALHDWSQHLADEGYLVLSSKVRHPDECLEIVQVLRKHLRRDVDPDALFTLSEKTSAVTKPILESLLSKKIPGFEHVVWTFQTRKMAVLLSKACDFKEPVLLIGETGGGKTTVCQLLSLIRQQELSIVNCHMHTEASDFLGSLRPVRDRKETQRLFEWVDGPLVRSMKSGGFFLVDEISLADDSVLERLNSLLEPERKLLIAEKPSAEENATVSAHEDFIFVGTMNPGGDYGKKELSPALRNRFTEIWCEGCASTDDLRCIMAHNLRQGFGDSVPAAMIKFLKWLRTAEIGKKLVVSVRDVLTWVDFVNSCEDLGIGDAFFHGAALSYIDGLGSGSTAAENSRKLKDFKVSALDFIEQQVQSTLSSKLILNCDEFDIESDEEKFGVRPFYLKKGNERIPSNVGFAFASPTTRMNTLKVLRASQLRKPILLEGSPGVGKTSLVSALARASGHRLLRLNLSDQTDISDLFGADLPVEGGKPGEFCWRDGPFLRALKNGDWILLDELNLASQSVLEGLNACLDHRSEVYIPELAMTFAVKPGTRLFGCQNPLRQGGARRGLPKSFLNRFTQVFVDALEQRDLKFILKVQFPDFPDDLLDKMIQFNEELSARVGTTWGHSGSPWEMNLRDVTRWCELTMASYKQSSMRTVSPGTGAQLIYVDRMRTNEDKKNVCDIYDSVFSLNDHPLPNSEVPVHVAKDKVFFGNEILDRNDTAVYEEDDLLLLRGQRTVLRGLVQCVNMNWMAILIGGTGSGKTSLVHLLASMAGQKLKSIVVNSAMDTTEILGGFEQTDYDRHLEELLDRVETLLIGILRKKLAKENLDQLARYHALLENVRHLSADSENGGTMDTTMSTETKLFLRKTVELSKLVSAMKVLEAGCASGLLEIEEKLKDLSVAVEKDKCLNAGGKFEWVDSVLVKCLQNGTWLLLDQVNLCSPAILDRLNGLLEPNGSLTIGEKGVDKAGNVFTVKAHENFRLFLTMDPRHGEISRAMRNRGVEISIPTPRQVLPNNRLDVVSLLNNCGIRRLSHQKTLLKIHESLYESQYKLNEMLQVASFTSQQMSKGFTFDGSLENSYRELCGTFDWRSRRDALRKIRDILSAECADVDDEFAYDLNAVTFRVSDLRKNARLTSVKQQGFLFKSAAEKLRNDPGEIDFQDLFRQSPITDTMTFMKHLLLDFYERSSIDDLEIRQLWASNIFTRNGLVELGKINEYLGKEVESLGSLFENKSTLEMPLSLMEPPLLSNNLVIVLYFRLIILQCELDGQVVENGDIMCLREYSSAVCSGRLSSNLKNEPLIQKFVQLVDEFGKIINTILRNARLPIDDKTYIELRDGLKWYQRFQKLGATELIDKSRGTFFDLREISSILKVHYKWLAKFFRKVTSLCNAESCNRTQQELMDFSNRYMNIVVDGDKFRKIRKKAKKLLSIPSPHFSEESMIFHEKLRSLLRKLEITVEDSVALSKTKLKIVTVGQTENLAAREKLMNICLKNFMDNRECPSRADDLIEIEEIASKMIEPREINDSCTKIAENFREISIWPIYEFFFTLFAYRFQRKFCDEFSSDRVQEIMLKFNESSPNETSNSFMDWEGCNESFHGDNAGKFGKIYEENVFKKFEEIPTIPAHLISLMKALNSDETLPHRRMSLFHEFLFFVEEFSGLSFAVKNSNVLLHWHDRKENEDEENDDILEASFISKSALCNLIFELFLTKSGIRREIINFGNYKQQKRLLQTIQALIWKNSLILNSDEFDMSTNDSVLLQFYINYYLSAINKTIIALSSNFNDEQQDDLRNRLLEPIKLLQNTEAKLKNENSEIERGIGWLILGYVQIFLFYDLGPIDPVRKIALKSKYIRENISELQHLMCVEDLQSAVLGRSLPVDRKLSRTNHLIECSNEVRSFEDSQAARPTASYQSLREEIENFTANIGSFDSIFRQMRQLRELGEELERRGSQEPLREKLHEATIWKKSLERFSGKLERNFLVGFPDLVTPMISGISSLHRGVSILIHELVNRQPHNRDSDICYSLLRFPVVGPCQEHYIKLAKLCSSEKLLFHLTNQSKSRSVQRDRLTMAKIALKEMENLSLVAGKDLDSLWEELNKVFLKIRILWKEQEKQREAEAEEKQSLFKTKSESKEDEEDFRKMFPGYQEDFLELAEMFPGYQDLADLQRIPEDCSNEKESFSELISLEDARRIQETHWNILRNCCPKDRNLGALEVRSSRKARNNLEPPESDSEPNFVEPLIQRFEMLGPLVKTWPEGLSSQLVCSLNVLVSRKSSFDDRKRDQGVYDFYRDPNIPEIEDCQPLFERLCGRINEFLIEWPENPILNSIRLIIDRLFSFSVDSSLSRFLVGVELLLTKIQQWEENARSTVSLAEFIESFGEKILRWRKLEISRWKDSLEVLEDDSKTKASMWWFFLFNLVDQYISEDTELVCDEQSDRPMDADETKQTGKSESAENKTDDASREKVVESLERFLMMSSLIEFETRLKLIYLFYRHVSHLDETGKRKELSAILWNIYFYYSQFTNDVRSKIEALKEPIAKKVKDTIKITRWNDISYWSVKNTAEKTRRTLHKYVKEFQKGLREHASSYLTLKTKAEAPEAGPRRELNPSDFLIDVASKKSNKIERLASKACQFCENIVAASNYPQIRKDIEVFIEDSLEESRTLKNMDVDKTLTKAKQRSQLKSMLQLKKMALVNYFRALSRLGISYRIGILTWRNRKNEITNFTCTPLDLREIQSLGWKIKAYEIVENGLVEQWSGCDKYYYESLIKLNFLDGILNSGKSDLGIQNIERCRGLSVHLVSLAHRQKETIANFFNYFLPLRIHIANLAAMTEGDVEGMAIRRSAKVPRQENLQLVVNNLQDLLEILQLSVKQLVVFLESCPGESLSDESILDLNEAAVPVLNEQNITRDSIISMKDSLNVMKSMANELNSWLAISKRMKRSEQVLLLHRRHLDFLQSSYEKINQVKGKLVDLKLSFTLDHPIADNLSFLVSKIDESNELFRSTVESSMNDESGNSVDYQRKLDQLITQVLLVIQKKLQDSQKAVEEKGEPEKESVEEDFQDNLMTEGLVESLRKDVPDLKVKTVSRMFAELLKVIYECDANTANDCVSSLLEHLPLLEQYSLLLHYYLHEQVASFRLTCKFLYLQLNVFLDLATNGFCQPDDADAPTDDQEAGTAEGGMGLAEGEGKKDISESIETEDQLEETRGPNDEDKDNEKKDMEEEEKGIEMSENFEGHMQDLEEREDEEEKEEDDDLDKEMGETDETAEKLDEEMWKDEEEEEEEAEKQGEQDEKEESGTGEKTGQEELGAKDNEESKASDKDEKGDGERKEEEKKEINEFDEPEVNDDQIDPYHGKHQPEVEPESFDLPEDINLDDEAKEDNPGGEEEDPFDIDRMKETEMPEEKEDEEAEEKEGPEEDDKRQDSGSEEDGEEQEDPNTEGSKRKDEKVENPEEEKEEDAEKEKAEEENQMEEDKATTSFDPGSKEVDASEEVDSRKDGSRDAVESQSKEEQMEVSPTENSSDDKKDKGTGQSQTEEREGHSGSKQEENAPTSGEEKSSMPIPKRRKPGQSDENRSLVRDDVQPSAKKLKTTEMQHDPDSPEERQNEDAGGRSETYEHIKNNEKFDDYVFDAATAEQIKQQASNPEEDKKDEPDKKVEDDDVEMHEDPAEEDQKEEATKEQSQKVPDSKKEKTANAKGERSDDAEKIEVGGEIEGEAVETTRVLRGNESSIHTKLETETIDLTTEDVAQKRSEIESMLGQWTQGPSSIEAANAWSSISALTEPAARELSEKLRLVLEPTLTSRLKGDYRTGRRINMRKVIPYIASEFRKDKIWLRRTKPSKRDYQIVLAIDDSSSMADNHSKELAFESLSLIGKAMTYLEVGQLAVINFGEQVNVLHPFGENFTEESGARLIQDMKFEQKKTMIGQLLNFTIDMFSNQSSSSDNAKLVTILSDGRGIFSEGIEKVTAAVRRAKLLNIFLVFVVVDNPLNKDSILDIRMPIFEDGKLLGIRSYMDNFPFPFYIILRDLDTLPVVLSDALRQWFEIVGRIDT